jgi:hypothetical protein
MPLPKVIKPIYVLNGSLRLPLHITPPKINLAAFFTAIDFDQDPSSQPVADATQINSLYASVGATFATVTNAGAPTPGATAPAFARSLWPSGGQTGNNIASIYAMPRNAVFFEDSQGLIQVFFPSPVTFVSIYALAASEPDTLFSGNSASRPYMKVFDAGGNLLATEWYPNFYNENQPDPNFGSWQILTHSAPSGNISYLLLSCSQPDPTAPGKVYAVFDSLAYSYMLFF